MSYNFSEDPLQMIQDAVAGGDRDWSQDVRDAVIFAIVCGWHAAMPELSERFGWEDEQIMRLTVLRSKFVELCPGAGDT
jgi:hypothetical protein